MREMLARSFGFWREKIGLREKRVARKRVKAKKTGRWEMESNGCVRETRARFLDTGGRKSI